MPHFDPLGVTEPATALRTSVALLHGDNIFINGIISLEIDTHKVVILLICTTDQMPGVFKHRIKYDFHAFRQIERPHISRYQPRLLEFLFGKIDQFVGTDGIAGFDLLQCFTASHREEDDFAFSLVVDRPLRYGLDQIIGIDFEKFAQRFDRRRIGGVKLRIDRFGGLGIALFVSAYCRLDIGTIVTRFTDNDRILSAVRQDHKLFAATASDRTTVGFDYTELQPQPRKDLFVGLFHMMKFTPHILFICVKTIAIFHQKFTSAHQAESGSDLITELQIDLIEVDRKLLVASDRLLHQGNHHLFMCRPQDKFIVFSIFET